MKHALKTNTGEQTRARVFLRRDLNREPSQAEVDQVKKDKSLKSRVTPAQIVEDFNSGTEVRPSSISEFLMDNVFGQQLVVWGMKCIGYNYEFERHLTDNLAAANTHTRGK